MKLQLCTLLDLCRSFDGGVEGLARRCNVAPHRIYKFASGRHAHPPVDIINGVAEAFGRSENTVIGERITKTMLLEWWVQVRAERQKEEEEC
jgi:transcriptional regulator with XRE-family HTH domain